MKKLFTLGIILVIFGVVFYYREDLIGLYMKTFSDNDRVVSFEENIKSPYYIDRNYLFVQQTPSGNFVPKDKQDLLNIYYAVLNIGLDSYTFYCPEEYKSCINDVKDISDDQVVLSHINNFVHAFNGFKNIETEYDSLGKVNIRASLIYTKEKEEELNKRIGEIEKELYSSTMSIEDKIKVVHDYIITHSKYDSERSDQQITKYDSDTAYGNLMQGYGICGGYADSMKLFLDRMNVPNYKIASENHVWNLVYVENEWLHLDLTWDDPVVTNGKDILEYNFFLITTKELNDLKTNQHVFDSNVYKEAK